jgi:isoleucyl-tRNA synthetase
VHVAPAFGEDDNNAHKKLLLEHPRAAAAVRDRPRRHLHRARPEAPGPLGEGLRQGPHLRAQGARQPGALRGLPARVPVLLALDNDPLIQFARPAWYIRTTAEIDRAIENNLSVKWLPEHIKEGRFGDFLRNNVDWALSRERYWGTPLNIWVNDETGELEAPSSVAEIEPSNPAAFDAFHAAKQPTPRSPST